VSTRAGLPRSTDGGGRDGTRSCSRVDYGATGCQRAGVSPDARRSSTASGRHLAGSYRVRTRALRIHLVGGRIQPGTDSLIWLRVGSFGYRQLWFIDVETGRIRRCCKRAGAPAGLVSRCRRPIVDLEIGEDQNR